MSIYEILLGLIWHNPSKPNYALECNHGKGGGASSGDIETSWLLIYFTIFFSILLV